MAIFKLWDGQLQVELTEVTSLVLIRPSSPFLFVNKTWATWNAQGLELLLSDQRDSDGLF